MTLKSPGCEVVKTFSDVCDLNTSDDSVISANHLGIVSQQEQRAYLHGYLSRSDVQECLWSEAPTPTLAVYPTNNRIIDTLHCPYSRFVVTKNTLFSLHRQEAVSGYEIRGVWAVSAKESPKDSKDMGDCFEAVFGVRCPPSPLLTSEFCQLTSAIMQNRAQPWQDNVLEDLFGAGLVLRKRNARVNPGSRPG